MPSSVLRLHEKKGNCKCHNSKFPPPNLQVVFEDFGFQSYLPMPSTELCMRAFAAQQPEIPANTALCGLVIDSGFSSTHIVPIFDGNVLQSGVKRINVGGRLLTNFLKELVSYRCLLSCLI